MYLADYHTHSRISPDGKFTMAQMAQAALDKGNFSREAFALWEIRNMGRIEVGYTDSVARKLGVGLQIGRAHV